MPRITVRDANGHRSIVLDAAQTSLFVNEFERTRRFAEPDSRPLVLMAPDCIVEVDDNGRVARFELVGRAVLREAGKRQFQFYFGLLLLEWLAA
jgi:hypothetical protein